MEWQTDKRMGTLFGGMIIAALLLFDVGVVLYLRIRPINLLTFLGGLWVVVSLPILAGVVYRLINLRRSGYALDRNQLTVFWGATRHVIPTRLIEQIIPGEEVSGRIRFSGGRWPGLWVGHADVPGIGLTLFNATAPIEQQLIVVTDMAAYAISPIDRQGFVEAVQTRKVMGPTQDVLQESLKPKLFDWPLWTDRLARVLLLGAAALCAGLFAYVCLKYAGLPSRIPLHFNAAGIPDRLAAPVEVFILPVIGLLAVAGNLVAGVPIYLHERLAAYLLWSGAILVQGLLWVAAVTLLV
jgi:hypothetical protein